MAKNNKGIVLTSLIYTLLVFFLLLVAAALLLLAHRQTAIDRIRDNANDIFQGSE